MAIQAPTRHKLDNTTYDGQLQAEFCVDCGVPFGVDREYARERKRDHRTFYCPNGHGQHWPQKTDAEKERERREQTERELGYARHQRDSARTEAEFQRRSAAAEKGHRTRTLNLIKAGVCPICKQRNFTNVRRHMEMQHPDESES